MDYLCWGVVRIVKALGESEVYKFLEYEKYMSSPMVSAAYALLRYLTRCRVGNRRGRRNANKEVVSTVKSQDEYTAILKTPFSYPDNF